MRMRPGFARLSGAESPPSKRSKFVLKDFDDLLARRDAAQNVLSQRSALDARDKVLGDPEMDIRLEKSHPDFAQGIRDILLADAPMSAEVFENVLKFVRKPGKHRRLSVGSGQTSRGGRRGRLSLAVVVILAIREESMGCRLFGAETGIGANESSVNCSSALGSRVRRVPRIAARKPSGMLTIPGLVSGKSGAA